MYVQISDFIINELILKQQYGEKKLGGNFEI